MMHDRFYPSPSEVRGNAVPAEIEPATQREAAMLARLQTARMLASTIDDKSRRVIASNLGMTPSDVERELAFYDDVKSGRQVPTVAPDQLRAILGGGA